ncbi:MULTISPECIES: hypothetical protein [unclassified Streptomyces]|uniref:hypothetical protein n=1 Tax=unclassified Streptomyces TaxID=2593676 RepID=UPI00037EFDD6|nr:MULTISPECIES: hypothetical protein [unclassified Streptomyces]
MSALAALKRSPVRVVYVIAFLLFALVIVGVLPTVALLVPVALTVAAEVNRTRRVTRRA